MGRINKSQYAILGWLSKGSMSGYDIKKMVNNVSPFYWSESNAQIYPILKKLEAEGMVDSKIDKNSGARQRRIYSLTGKGLQHLKQWLKRPVEPCPYREELLLKLTMSDRMPIDTLINHLEDYREQLQQQQKHLQTTKKYPNNNHNGHVDAAHIKLLNRFTQLNLSAKLKWCTEALQTIQT